ncbi:Methyl-accepting chemotaxis protein [Photobacterium marinum]|uniref:Methyl-accepting chemotaxis protein n=1 Tax=Photobacterium marinum TaxID=1056511 RepID=L8J3I2_9GAMM|nr:methyl-accepting chemotaxis protein [Photobacterium marinum]ELR63420.1 Methyl-accepting chemotaxis protein [Photobacterium marinum]
MKLLLKQKLIAASLFTVLLMAGSLTWLAANELQLQTQNDINTRARTLAATATKNLADWITVRSEIIHSLNHITDKPALGSYLQQAKKAGNFDDIYAGFPTGHFYRADESRYRNDYDPRIRPWYKTAKQQNQQIITSAYRSVTSNALMITIAEPVSENGSLKAVIGGDILIEQLVDDITRLKIGKNAQIMLIDKQTQSFLAHSEKALQLQPVTRYSNVLSMKNISDTMRSHEVEALTINGKGKLLYFTPVPKTQWLLAIEMDQETEEAGYHHLLQKLIISSIIITLFTVMLVAALVNFLFRDLGRVSAALADIANGEGDLTQRLEPCSDDEVGQLAHNFNRFVGNMHSMMSRLQQVSNTMNQQSELTATQAEERNKRIQHQQDEVNMIATAINQMACATQEIADNANNTAKTAEQSVTISQHGSAQVSQSQQSISKLAGEVKTTTEVIGELDVHAQNINTILSTIQDIAEQTNLLALNAAIEAARAGVQGRGFAVVADEVRILSQRTHSSTQEIQQMIENLQRTTNRAVGIMNDSRRLSDTSVDDANSAAASLAKINSSVNNINDMATRIASAAEEQSSVTTEITRNTAGIRDVANLLATEADEAAQQAAKLSLLSQELQQEIGQFKL